MFSLCDRIRRARAIARLTQAELARRLGVNRSAVTQWEHAGGTTPSVAHLSRIATEANVCFEWLATGRGPCRPGDGAFDSALVLDDFARDDLESRLLSGARRVSPHKREALLRIVELLTA
jgi:transcriptional regulator with XRE-family HTH domain